MADNIGYEGKKLEDIRNSVKVGDKVTYLRRNRITEKSGWLINAVVTKKYPQLVKVSYTWEGREETAYMSYKDLYLFSVGNTGMPVTKKDGTLIAENFNEPVSPEKLFGALKKKIR